CRKGRSQPVPCSVRKNSQLASGPRSEPSSRTSWCCQKGSLDSGLCSHKSSRVYSQFLHSRNQGCSIDAQSHSSSRGPTHPALTFNKRDHNFFALLLFIPFDWSSFWMQTTNGFFQNLRYVC